MRRGSLRIYVGYAPGVGKTYAMLSEAHRRRERGADVVIGFVQAHGRAQSLARIGDLEVIPPRPAGDIGEAAHEMDLDRVLARAPQIALVDELAHTNAPGGRNAKRWQDAVELLEAGIDVISTVNILDLESLQDVIERIAGSRSVDTVPDTVVRGADQLELVDMTPQALRRRLVHGNVFPPERMDARLSLLLQAEHLAALRELSLLWMADRVDESLRESMRPGGVRTSLESRERILVGVAGHPGDETLIRRAARLAARRGGELLAVHVAPEESSVSGASLTDARTLVEQVGGRFEEVSGRGVPEALLSVARAQDVTLMVLGAGERDGWPRWRELVRGSIVQQVLRASGSIDVHVVSRDAPTPRIGPVDRPSPGLPRRRRVLGLAVAGVALMLLTISLLGVHQHLGISSLLLLYLTLVVVVATVGGLWPAVITAVASSLVINWFFTPPLHTWTIAEPENVFALLVFLLVAVVVSVLVDGVARARADAERGRTEAEALARLAARLAAEDDPLPGLVEQLHISFGLDAVSVLRDLDGAWTVEAAAGPEPPASPEAGSDAIELGEDSVLVVRGPRLHADARRLLGAFAAQLAVAVRGRVLAREAAEAETLAQVDALRTAILAAVSHDLRTPLASIKAAVSSLRDPEVAWGPEETGEFLETIELETDRLTNLVGNLLDMSRLHAGALTLVRRVVGLDEVVPKALGSLAGSGRDVEVDVPETLPRVDVDPVLLERAVANIVANARTWSAPDRAVRIQGSRVGERVELRVIDRGPGVPQGERDRMFRPFQRLGDRPTGDGVGLGLAVARGFVEAMGGELAVEDTPGGGATMVLAFAAAPP